jgi:hypothetical protein
MADLELDGVNSKAKINKIESDTGSTVTLGQSGDTVTLGSGATLGSAFDPSQTVTWSSTIITTNTTLASGNGYFVNTTSGVITVTLPASPSVGDYLQIKDYAGTFGTNNLTIARNGSNIQGDANDSLITTNRAALKLVYADATKGWLYVEESNVGDLQNLEFVEATGGTITTSGNYKIHTFTSSGTFTVTSAGNAAGSDSVDYMVVGGGGAGGSHGPDSATNGGGGGAGGFRESVPSPAAWTASPIANPGGALPVSVQGYPVTIGAGATATYPGTGSTANKGSDSVFSTITSAGGGGGSAHPSANPVQDGGSGCGGAGTPSTEYAGGLGNSPSVSPPQGNPGGKANFNNKAGGGGGATSKGTDGATPAPYSPGQAAGGQGATTEINASSNTYAGGGGGSNTNNPNGGPGGGGSGGLPVSGSTGSNATANTGGGGGGGPHSNPGTPNNGGNGGSGVVIIRYKFQ